MYFTLLFILPNTVLYLQFPEAVPLYTAHSHSAACHPFSTKNLLTARGIIIRLLLIKTTEMIQSLSCNSSMMLRRAFCFFCLFTHILPFNSLSFGCLASSKFFFLTSNTFYLFPLGTETAAITKYVCVVFCRSV